MVQTNYQQQKKRIRDNIKQALDKLKNRERDGLTHKEIRALHKVLSNLYEELQDVNFKASQEERLFPKRYFVVKT